MSDIHYEDNAYYRGQIELCMLGKSSKKGTPCVKFGVRILAKRDRGEEDAVEQRTVEVIRYITENTIDGVVDDLRRLGYPYDSFAQLDPDHPQYHDFTDVEVVVKCKHEPFTSETSGTTTYNEKFEFAGTGGTKAIDRKGVAELDALFGGALKAKKLAGAQAAATPARQQPLTPPAGRKPAGRTAAPVASDEANTEEFF